MEYIISDKLIELLQFRINQEEYSSRLYRAMSEWFFYNGYTGAGSLWKKYSEEELTHAEWSYKYLSDMDVLPKVDALEKPPCEFKSFREIVDMSYEHEVTVTQQCNELYVEATKEGCATIVQLALKYQAEQVEEIGKLTTWLDKLDAFGDEKLALRFLDNEMSGV